MREIGCRVLVVEGSVGEVWGVGCSEEIEIEQSDWLISNDQEGFGPTSRDGLESFYTTRRSYRTKKRSKSIEKGLLRRLRSLRRSESII